MSKLVIVESPTKAKTIKKYLGSSYNVVASLGHVRDLPKSQMGIDVENDFEPKYITIRGKGDLVSKLKKEAKGCDTILLATDPDREGEAISWHLAKVLGLPEDAKVRVAFNEVTKAAVQAAVKHPRLIDKDLVNAQQTRRILDRLVGYEISPFMWKTVRRGLSAGRVQSVATRLIVERENEINAFEPVEYWTLTAKFQGATPRSLFSARFYGNGKNKIELSGQRETDEVVKALEKENYTVGAITKGKKTKSPAPPFITSTLQQEASRRLNFQSRRTMQVAQELYEGIDIKGTGTIGLITYMRTDSLRISNESQQDAKTYIVNQFGEEYYPNTPRFYKSKSSSQDAHEAIRPTVADLSPAKIKDSLTTEQFRLYKLIWERFMASQMESAVYDTVSVDIEAGDYLFKTAGSTINFAGYTVLYDDGKEDKEEGGFGNLPPVKEGETLIFKELLPEQHFTKPPARYNEASLIKVLEENGIGRPSTYAPTITTILARGYVVREGKNLRPTPLGEITTDLMKNHFSNIVDVDFTAKMEGSLDHIETGEVSWVNTLKDFYKDFSQVMEKAKSDLGDVQIKVPDEVSDVICENCGKNLVVKMGKFGKFLACPGYPECRNTKAIVVDTGAACPKCGEKILQKRSKNGKRYYGCEKNPACDFMTWDEPLKERCPKCGDLILRKPGSKKKVHYSNTECTGVKEEKSEG